MRTLPSAVSLALTLFSASAFAGDFRLAFIDVGQGDAAVVIAPSGCAAILDGGPTGSGPAIKAYLRSQGVTQIDFAVVSHYHLDHIGGIDEVDSGTDALPIAAVYDRGGTYSSTTFTNYASHFSGKRHTVTRNQIVSLCSEVTFKVVAVNGNGISSTNENAYSVAMKVSYGSFDAMIGGDLTGQSPDIESTLLGNIGEVEVYKVHHHGSQYSSNDTFLDELMPTVSVISVGIGNTYGHPTDAALTRLRNHGTIIYQTEDPATNTVRGNVVMTSATGTNYIVAQGGSSTSFAAKGAPAQDLTAPTAPGALVASAAGQSEIDLSWSASTDNVGVTGYSVYRSTGGAFTLAGTTSGTGFADLGLAAGTSYTYRVTAQDAAGNVSANSNTATATTASGADTTAPSAPANLTATASGQTQINVAWSASTDNVGVAGYDVYRSVNGGGFTLLTSTAATSLSDTGLQAGTSYAYYARAVDAAGNVSGNSNTASATTQAAADTQAPSAPATLTATASGTSQVNLSWAASSDNVGVVGYDLYRSVSGGAFSYLVTVQGGTAYNNTGLSAATSYAYFVRAVDGAGNVSTNSPTASATTAASTSPGKVIINEILANEPGSATSGEFVELVNVGGASVDISGWAIWDGSASRHVFASGTVLGAGKAIVVFGSAAGIPAGTPNAIASSTGDLNLTNGGDTVSLRPSKRTKADSFTYGSALAAQDGVSMNRSPDATAGASFVLHNTIASQSASPGVRPSGAAY